MRLFTLCIAIILCGQQAAMAQRRVGKAKRFVFANITAGFGSPNAYKASLAGLFKKRHEVSVGFCFSERRARGVPQDYTTNSLLGGSNYPQESFKGLVLTYGRVLYPRKDAGLLRFVLRGGLLIGQHAVPENFRPPASRGWFSPNYIYDNPERMTVAATVHPTIDCTPGRVFGLSAGLYAIVGDGFTGAGASFGIMLGRVSNRMRQRHIKAGK